MSEPTAEQSIFRVFADVKREVGPVGKDSRNQQQGFNFRGIDAVVNAAAGALDKHGVITVPELKTIEYTTVETGQKRTLMGHVRVEVTYRFYGPAGDCFPATVPGEAMDSGDKATAKAMSVAYRIALIQALNLPTGDPDPDSQTYERSPSSGRSGADFDNAAPAAPRNERQQDEPKVPPKLEPGDPWGDRIDDIHSAEEADALEAELRREFQEGRMDGERAGQIKHWLRVKAAPMRTASRSASAAPASPGDGTADDKWIGEFRSRLETAIEDALTPMLGEIGRAVAGRAITPEQGSVLSGEVRQRRRELQEQAAAEAAAEATEAAAA